MDVTEKKNNNEIPLKLYGKITNIKYDFINGKLIINLQDKSLFHKKKDLCDIELNVEDKIFIQMWLKRK